MTGGGGCRRAAAARGPEAAGGPEAADGTKAAGNTKAARSAKAAGAKRRKLTRTFYERLQDPRFYNVTRGELYRVPVQTTFWCRMYFHYLD